MMLVAAMAGLAAFGVYTWLKLPGYERCPAGRRKKKRKTQAEVRRILRDPKHRGDRATHRAARRLLRLTRKPRPGVPLYRPMTDEEMARAQQETETLLAKWAFEETEKRKAEVRASGKVIYEDEDSIFTEAPVDAHETDGGK